MENHSYILDNVKKIQKAMKEGKNQSELEVDFTEFKEKYPKTFIHILEGNFSIVEFNKMKNIYNNVYNKKQGDDIDKDNLGNVAVGNYLAEKYLYPKFGKPSSQDMQKGYEQVLIKKDELKEHIKKK